MEIVKAKKGKGLDELLQRISLTAVEEIKSVSGGGALASAVQTFYTHLLGKDYSQAVLDGSLQALRETLSPREINLFLQVAIRLQAYIPLDDIFPGIPYGRYSTLLGYTLTQLIQNSYDAGCNDFIIHTVGLQEPINRLGVVGVHLLRGGPQHQIIRRLQGTEENPLRVTVVGDIGERLGTYAEYLHCEVQGKVEAFCSAEGKHNYFKVRKLESADYATNTVWIVQDISTVAFNFNWANCSIKTASRRTLQKILKSKDHYERCFVEPPSRGNKIYFINKDGSETIVWDDQGTKR